ncbi:hypothetical protein CTheo_2961 [Ceratobasidium theobromae]|uniref:NACHT domain-containing protein n=1 Tax=Ceratobasidium theobromae TaxID=1582974 RepID=A0A5N5QP72_9AGAM|nr:hypothetical protein CTheo_2961 [Ceratobasidium theobromae]
MTTQLDTPTALPSLEPLLKTSAKRTASIFCAETGDIEEEKSVRVRLAIKTRDEYSDVQTLPSALLAREGIVGPTRPGTGPKAIAGPPQKLITAGPADATTPSTTAPSTALTTFRQQNSVHTGAQSALTTALARRKAARQVQPDYHAPWKLVRVISGHLGWVRSVAVEPGNKWFVTGAGDRVIKVWDLASGELRLSLTGHISTVRGLAVSPRHPYLFSAGEDKMVKCWDLETNKVIRHYHGHLSGVYALDLHPTLDVLVTAGRDASARVWDMRTKAQIHVLAGHTGTVADVRCQESDPQVITGSMDSTIRQVSRNPLGLLIKLFHRRLWDLAAGKTMSVLTHHKKSVRALAVHPTEFSFASGSAGGNNIKKWKCPEGIFVHNFSGHDAIVNTLSVNAEGVLFSGGDNGTITFWDYKTGLPFQNMDDIPQPGSLEAEAGVFCSTFDQTGTRLITGSADKTIKYNDVDLINRCTRQFPEKKAKPTFTNVILRRMLRFCVRTHSQIVNGTARSDGVVGYHVCLTFQMFTDGPQFEPGSLHFFPLRLSRLLIKFGFEFEFKSPSIRSTTTLQYQTFHVVKLKSSFSPSDIPLRRRVGKLSLLRAALSHLHQINVYLRVSKEGFTTDPDQDGLLVSLGAKKGARGAQTGVLPSTPTSMRTELTIDQSRPTVIAGSGSPGWAGLRTALEHLRRAARQFPPIESAVGAFISCLDVLEATVKERHEYDNIASELKMLAESLTQHMSQTGLGRMSDCVANIASSIYQQAQIIQEKRNRNMGRRLMEANLEAEIIHHYRRIESLFRQLQTNVNLSTWSIANEVLANTRLEGLMPAKLASYDSTLSTDMHRRACTEGTRTTVLSQMDEWSRDPNAPELYWMNGMAGTGKTTIACSFSRRLDECKRLAASFFCTRASPECRRVSRIIPTIAYQFARYSIPFQGALCEVLGNEPDIGSKNVAKQMERLLQEPLEMAKGSIPENLVVVIDALDECEDRHGVKLMLDLLFKFVPSLPLKFLVASRPEPEIYNKMIAQSYSRVRLHLHEIEKSLVQADIQLYLNEELRSISPTQSQIEQLARRSGNLFIYAATLVRYIRLDKQSANPQKRLRTVLTMITEPTKKHAEIDALYAAVLESALAEDDLEWEEVDDVRLLLHTALCVQEPVQVEVLAALAGLGDMERAFSALQPLRSVLHFSEISGMVSTLHASFPDFMFSKKRSGPFFCDPAQHNQLLARRCFEVMASQLQFNICRLESSFFPNIKVVEMKSRIEEFISPTLSYSCRYWGDHLRLSPNSAELCNLFREFLKIRLLFWMEVLSLKGEMGLGTQMMIKVKIWQASASSDDLIRFTEDALSFVTSYAANPVSQSVPHIYLSMLPFCPRSNLIFKNYSEHMQGLIELSGNGMDHRESAALASWRIGLAIRSVAYSPDASLLAFGCDEGILGIRNAYDGTQIIGPFKGHTEMVLSVAFSPLGTCIASGSRDSTTRVWSVEDGTLVAGPFEGHTDGVNAVAFSYDGAHIVSGSADHSICVWDVNGGSLVAGPFLGHTGEVHSVAFSPDSACIASGSDDCTIRVWRMDGTLSAYPFEGHTGAVYTVSFSPDGTKIVSGSADHTVRIWNTQDGKWVNKLLEGHTGEVNSVAFSSDGTRIVSGSDDLTVRVWNSLNGKLIAGPFDDHTDLVIAVAFSPHCMRVASGSCDRTIRIWNIRDDIPATRQLQGPNSVVWSVACSPDGTRIASAAYDHIWVWSANDGAPVAGPFKGHTGLIWSIAFAPDGTRIASGSKDCTIRVWNAQDGTLATQCLKGHTAAVYSVAFSPDGTRLVSSSHDLTLRIWSSRKGELVAGPFEGHTGIPTSVAFSPNGERIVSGSYDRTLRVWDISNGTVISNSFHGHTDSVMSVAFSLNGLHIASGSIDCTVRLWNTDDGTLVTDPFIGHTGVVDSVAFSPDGAWVVSGSGDRTIRVWNTLNGALIAGPFHGHADRVTSVAFLADGAHIVSGSTDHAIRVWDIRSSSHASNINNVVPHKYIRPSAAHYGGWIIADDGWIVGEGGRLLFWVPRDVLRSLLTPHCDFIICPSGTITADIGRALLGDRWHECYILKRLG